MPDKSNQRDQEAFFFSYVMKEEEKYARKIF